MAPTNPDATGSGTPGFISPEEMMGEIVTSRAGAKRTDVFRSVLNVRNDDLPRQARDERRRVETPSRSLGNVNRRVLFRDDLVGAFDLLDPFQAIPVRPRYVHY
eukprot:COSAG06_NODE_2050_length_7734_cov_4.844008_4_plen_104_part_00